MREFGWKAFRFVLHFQRTGKTRVNAPGGAIPRIEFWARLVVTSGYVRPVMMKSGVSAGIIPIPLPFQLAFFANKVLDMA